MSADRTRPCPPLFELAGAGVDAPSGPLFRNLDWRVQDLAVTVLMGPSGTGKSALMRGLAGEPGPPGWRYDGTWLHRGGRLSPLALPGPSVAWVPQARRVSPSAVSGGGAVGPRWRAAFLSGARTLLLDEPTPGNTVDEIRELASALRAHARSGGAVVVTHDLQFARSVADQVALVCAGRLLATADVDAFFDAPPNELAARFVIQGNCWPAAPAFPDLPSHFHWVLPGRLAGMGRPGLLGDIDNDLAAVAGAGVRLLVTLTEDPLPPDRVRALGLEGRHFPIPDMGVPAISPTASLCRAIDRTLRKGDAVAVHCHGGMGRTGTILAAMLVWLGRPADAAVTEVRQVAPGYIQNRGQADFVHRFAAAVGTLPKLRESEP